MKTYISHQSQFLQHKFDLSSPYASSSQWEKEQSINADSQVITVSCLADIIIQNTLQVDFNELRRIRFAVGGGGGAWVFFYLQNHSVDI